MNLLLAFAAFSAFSAFSRRYAELRACYRGITHNGEGGRWKQRTHKLRKRVSSKHTRLLCAGTSTVSKTVLLLEVHVNELNIFLKGGGRQGGQNKIRQKFTTISKSLKETRVAYC